MPHRQFRDSKRTTWDVWDVEPSHAERRRAERDRRSSPRGPDRRRTVDTARVRVRSNFAHGWLCFESKHDKRRLAPIPERWDELDEVALEQLLHAATSVGRPRRLIE